MGNPSNPSTPTTPTTNPTNPSTNPTTPTTNPTNPSNPSTNQTTLPTNPTNPSNPSTNPTTPQKPIHKPNLRPNPNPNPKPNGPEKNSSNELKDRIIYFAKTADLNHISHEIGQFNSALQDNEDYKKMEHVVKEINNQDHEKLIKSVNR